MTTTINASPSNGIVQTADGSGVMKLQSNGVTTNALAWVNFNGNTGAISASYNVGSVTRNATGDYTLNFTTATSDANYAPIAILGYTAAATTDVPRNCTGKTWSTSSFRFVNQVSGGAAVDYAYQSVAVFGN